MTSYSEPNTIIQSPQVAESNDPLSDKDVEKNQSDEEYVALETGYDTFLREEKEEILIFLKRQMLTFKRLDASLLNSETSKKPLDWIKLLKETGAKSFNQLLKEIIPQYRPKLTLSTKELTNLRKKIKGWLKRGDPLIHDDGLPRFKEVLKQVMRVRNFDQLRKNVLPYVREIRMKSSKKFVDSMFSKKFWSTFLNKEENRDIKAIWERLPLLKDSHIEKPNTSVTNKFFPGSLDFLAGKQKQRTRESTTHISKLEEEAHCNDDDDAEKNECIMEDHAHAFLRNFEETKTSSFKTKKLFLSTRDSLQNSVSEGLKEIQSRTQDTVQTDFIESFWSTWNERSLVENTDSNTTVFIRPEKVN